MERLSRFSRMKILSAELDSPWSWFLCFLAALCNALHFGVSLSFGILLPYLLEHFKASIDITGMAGQMDDCSRLFWIFFSYKMQHFKTVFALVSLNVFT